MSEMSRNFGFSSDSNLFDASVASEARICDHRYRVSSNLEFDQSQQETNLSITYDTQSIQHFTFKDFMKGTLSF